MKAVDLTEAAKAAKAANHRCIVKIESGCGSFGGHPFPYIELALRQIGVGQSRDFPLHVARYISCGAVCDGTGREMMHLIGAGYITIFLRQCLRSYFMISSVGNSLDAHNLPDTPLS
jgi:hypothetical protein